MAAQIHLKSLNAVFINHCWALLATLYFKISGRRSWYLYNFLFGEKFPLFLTDKDIFQIVFHNFLCCYKNFFYFISNKNMSLLFKQRQMRSKKPTVAVHSVYNYPYICCKPPSIKYEVKMTSSGKNNSKYIFFLQVLNRGAGTNINGLWLLVVVSCGCHRQWSS